MSKKCRAYSESKLGLEPPDNRKAFYAGWDAALRAALAIVPSDCPYSHQPQRQPLTDREIHDCFQQRSRDKTKERRLITRAIERAHGIGGEYER